MFITCEMIKSMPMLCAGVVHQSFLTRGAEQFFAPAHRLTSRVFLQPQRRQRPREPQIKVPHGQIT
jgi:hypothetical protein